MSNKKMHAYTRTQINIQRYRHRQTRTHTHIHTFKKYQTLKKKFSVIFLETDAMGMAPVWGKGGGVGCVSTDMLSGVRFVILILHFDFLDGRFEKVMMMKNNRKRWFDVS